jgi:hypothetical protein
LVDWSEEAMMEADFDVNDITIIRNVIARLGFAHIREFGLSWEDCEDLIGQLGYHTCVDLIAD